MFKEGQRVYVKGHGICTVIRRNLYTTKDTFTVRSTTGASAALVPPEHMRALDYYDQHRPFYPYGVFVPEASVADNVNLVLHRLLTTGELS